MMSQRDVIAFLTKTMELRAVRATIDVPVGQIGQLGRTENVAIELVPVGLQTRIHANLPVATAAVVDTYDGGAHSKITAKEVRLEFTGVANTVGAANWVEINGKRFVFWAPGSAAIGAGYVTVPVDAAALDVTCANALVTTFAAHGFAGVVAATLPTDDDVVAFTSQQPFTATSKLANVSTTVAAQIIGGVASFDITTPPMASCDADDTTVVTFDNYNLPNGFATLTGPTVTLGVI